MTYKKAKNKTVM